MFARLLGCISADRLRLVRYYVVGQPICTMLAPKTAQPRSTNPSSSIHFCNGDDNDLKQFPRPADVIAARFARGHRCLRATQRSKFAGYIWLARDYYDEDEVRCRYRLARPESSVWDYDVYIAPEFRIGRTFARLWQRASEELAREGVKWSFSRISAFNADSLRAHARLGAAKICSVTFMRIGQSQLTVASTFPYIHIGLAANSFPEFILVPPR